MKNTTTLSVLIYQAGNRDGFIHKMLQGTIAYYDY